MRGSRQGAVALTGGVLLRAEHVTKSFGNVAVLVDVSLSVAAGELVTLLGPNGSGKTTLMRIVMGLDRPTLGTAVCDPNQTTAIFGSGALPTAWTVEDVAEYFGRLGGGHQRIVEALADAGMWDSKSLRVRQCSLGMRQRVLLALAIARRSSLILLDEPSTGLDLESRGWLASVLNAQRRSGLAVVVTTHDLALAEALDTRLMHLVRGRIVHEESSAGDRRWTMSAFDASPSELAAVFADLDVDVVEEGGVLIASNDVAEASRRCVQRGIAVSELRRLSVGELIGRVSA